MGHGSLLLQDSPSTSSSMQEAGIISLVSPAPHPTSPAEQMGDWDAWATPVPGGKWALSQGFGPRGQGTSPLRLPGLCRGLHRTDQLFLLSESHSVVHRPAAPFGM